MKRKTPQKRHDAEGSGINVAARLCAHAFFSPAAFHWLPSSPFSLDRCFSLNFVLQPPGGFGIPSGALRERLLFLADVYVRACDMFIFSLSAHPDIVFISASAILHAIDIPCDFRRFIPPLPALPLEADTAFAASFHASLSPSADSCCYIILRVTNVYTAEGGAR